MSHGQVMNRCLISLLLCICMSCRAVPLTDDPEEARQIAYSAYIFFVPVINHWRTIMTISLSGFNKFWHFPASFTPNDRIVYSFAALDLGREPMVVHVPLGLYRNRYQSLQIVDGYTHNVGIVSQRTAGREGGFFVIAGPGQCNGPFRCARPIHGVVCAESRHVHITIRIQYFNSSDLESNVEHLRGQYRIRRFGRHCNVFVLQSQPPELQVPIERDRLQSLQFFHYANLISPTLTIHPSEQLLFYHYFARIGIVPGQAFPPVELPRKIRRAIQEGIERATADIDHAMHHPPNAYEQEGWQTIVNPQVGDRRLMQGRYLERAAVSRRSMSWAGIHKLDRTEVYYTTMDERTFGFDLGRIAGRRTYSITFSPDRLPPALGFWSIAMYDAESKQFVSNSIHRHSIGSADLNKLCHDVDGSFSIIIQRNPPSDPAYRRNWLPAPTGKFLLVARLYWPTEEAVTHLYVPPGVDIGPPPISLSICPPLH